MNNDTANIIACAVVSKLKRSLGHSTWGDLHPKALKQLFTYYREDLIKDVKDEILTQMGD